jgi:23S rRNA (guanosine2251-2'-O)-methyltransferase
VLLDSIEDPHNLGAIIRTAECAGAGAIIIPQRRAAQLNETVAKTSAGATAYMPVARVPNLSAFVEKLKSHGFWVVGVESSGEKDYAEQDYSGKLALVFGGEGSGLGRLVRERCDFIVSVPMHGHISSLNVSVAVGVVLFEVLRRRKAHIDQ